MTLIHGDDDDDGGVDLRATATAVVATVQSRRTRADSCRPEEGVAEADDKVLEPKWKIRSETPIPDVDLAFEIA